MKTLATFLGLCALCPGLRADSIPAGFLSVTILDNQLVNDSSGHQSDISLFVLKDFRWDIGNCIRIFHRNQLGEDQQDGATLDTMVPLTWDVFGFGLEWAAQDRTGVITLSNEAGWSLRPGDIKGDYYLSCTDPRFGSISFLVDTHSVPEAGWTAGLLMFTTSLLLIGRKFSAA